MAVERALWLAVAPTLTADGYGRAALSATARDWVWGNTSALMVHTWEAEIQGRQLRLGHRQRYEIPTARGLGDPFERLQEQDLLETTVGVMVAVEGTLFTVGQEPRQRLTMAFLLPDGTYEEAIQEEQAKDRISFREGSSAELPIRDALVGLLRRNFVWGVIPDWRGDEPKAAGRAWLPMTPRLSFVATRDSEVFAAVEDEWGVGPAVRELGALFATDDFGNEYTLVTHDLEHHKRICRAIDEGLEETGRTIDVDANSYPWFFDGWFA